MGSVYVPPALRQLVYQRAGGCCEYCLILEAITFAGHEIDHIIAQKHGGPTEADNLALSCVLCNKHKGSDIASLDPATGAIVPLFHPRHDRWGEHFQLNGAQLIPLTSTGRATVRLLQLNHPNRFVERERLLVTGILRVPN
jgi:hypothetical protein